MALIQQAVLGQFNTLNDWLSDKLVRLADQAGVPNIGGDYAELLKIQAAYEALTQPFSVGETLKAAHGDSAT